jgi:glycosyltransferase involved in cell wall biosynthesis
MANGIIIPCYNESDRLDINSFLDYAADNKHNILCFVNDGSSDATRSTLAKIKDYQHDNVRIYNVEENCGKAKAVQLGALHLYNDTRVNTIGFIDADLSTDFKDYDQLIFKMKCHKSLQVIYGSRAENGENNIKRDVVRGLISKIIRFIIFTITRLKIQDTQCGAKIFRRDIIPYVFDTEFKTRWLFDVEILLRLKRRFDISRFREMFLEKPLDNWVHMDGSKLGMKDAIQIPLNLLRIGYIYNIVAPFKRKVMVPLQSLVLHIADLIIFRLTTLGLSLTLMFMLSTHQIALNHPLNLLLLIIIGAYIANAVKSSMSSLKHVISERKWRWFKAHINTYMRKYSLKN